MFEKIISKGQEEEPVPQPPAAAPARPTDLSQPQAISSSPSGQRNVLLPDVEIVGKVRFENDLVVDGKIDGEISSDGTLTIGENARIKAEIKTRSVVVYGKVHGNITVTDRIELRANAEVVGDIKAAVLAMEAGAVLVGASTIGAPSSQDLASRAKEAKNSQAPRPESKNSQAPRPESKDAKSSRGSSDRNDGSKPFKAAS